MAKQIKTADASMAATLMQKRMFLVAINKTLSTLTLPSGTTLAFTAGICDVTDAPLTADDMMAIVNDWRVEQIKEVEVEVVTPAPTEPDAPASEV